MRSRHEEMRREDFGDHRPRDGQRRQSGGGAAARVLEPAVGQSGQYDVAMPADKRTPLEVIEPEFVLQFLVLLLDRPAVMRQADQGFQRRGRRQRNEVRLDARRRAEIPFEEQPHFGGEWAGVTRSAAK